MRQVWASLEWGGECENRETHTLGKGDTQTQRMQMEFRTQKRERLRRAASSTGATGLDGLI
ncbi:mCG140829 [Mus musculus]|nr:mCG140829 [Mus musculus]